MLMYCNLCSYISMLMQKSSLVGNPCMRYGRAEAKRLLNVNKRVLPASCPTGTLCTYRRITSVGLQTKRPAPRPPPFSKGYYNHSDRSSVRAGNGSTRVFKEEW